MPKPDRHVLVCINTRPPGNPKGSCGEKGSEALFDELKAMVKARGLGERVIVNQHELPEALQPRDHGGRAPDNVWYARRRPKDLDEICASHLEGGRPIERLFMPDIPWE